jgi:hypothetical protein
VTRSPRIYADKIEAKAPIRNVTAPLKALTPSRAFRLTVGLRPAALALPSSKQCQTATQS